MTRPRVLVLNGALGGANGNTAALLERACAVLSVGADTTVVHLAERSAGDALRAADDAQGFLFATGTYWDSWGSPLQRFLEMVTPSEATATWLGKPAAVLVTEHAVGGKGVLSRLQGVLVTFGTSIVPLGGLVLGQAGQAARQSASDPDGGDFWGPEDLDVVCENLLAALTGTGKYRAWSVDRGDARRRWVTV